MNTLTVLHCIFGGISMHGGGHSPTSHCSRVKFSLTVSDWDISVYKPEYTLLCKGDLC